MTSTKISSADTGAQRIVPFKPRFRALAAGLAWLTLIVQLGVSLTDPRYASASEAIIAYFGYFTILGNILVAFAFTAPFLKPGNRWRTFFEIPATRAAIALYITVIGLVYHIMLRHLWDPQGWQLATDISLHTVMPILYMIDWVFFARKSPMHYRHIPYWIIFPFVFGIVTLIRGAITGIYPYPFLDVNALGYTAVMTNMIGFMVLYVVGGLVFITLARYLPQPDT